MYCVSVLVFKNDLIFLTNAVQYAFMAFLGLAALAAVLATSLALAGVLPFLDLTVSYGGQVIGWGGMAAQLGLTVLLVALAGVLPSAWRVMRLEASHRSFNMDMDDITRAYRAAHMADRAQMFDMQREFDAVRERYTFLRRNPDLADIEAELLTVAAQMSTQSRDLAETFSDERLARTREALLTRRREADALKARLDAVRGEVTRLTRLKSSVESDEAAVDAMLHELESQMGVAKEQVHSRPKGATITRLTPAMQV